MLFRSPLEPVDGGQKAGAGRGIAVPVPLIAGPDAQPQPPPDSGFGAPGTREHSRGSRGLSGAGERGPKLNVSIGPAAARLCVLPGHLECWKEEEGPGGAAPEMEED